MTSPTETERTSEGQVWPLSSGPWRLPTVKAASAASSWLRMRALAWKTRRRVLASRRGGGGGGGGVGVLVAGVQFGGQECPVGRGVGVADDGDAARSGRRVSLAGVDGRAEVGDVAVAVGLGDRLAGRDLLAGGDIDQA